MKYSNLHNEIQKHNRSIWWNKNKYIIIGFLVLCLLALGMAWWNKANAMNGLAIHKCISDVRDINQVDAASTLKVESCLTNPYIIQ